MFVLFSANCIIETVADDLARLSLLHNGWKDKSFELVKSVAQYVDFANEKEGRLCTVLCDITRCDEECKVCLFWSH